MIIDVHAHSSVHVMKGLHTKNASISALRELSSTYSVAKILLMATYFPFKKTGLRNHELARRIRWDSLLGMVMSLDVMNSFQEGLTELDYFARNSKVYGIKLYPGYQTFDPGDVSKFSIYVIAKHYNLPVIIHTGELHHCCPVGKRQVGDYACRKDKCMIDKNAHLAEPIRVLPAIEAFPEVNFVLCHLGNPHFDQTRQLMMKYPNVYTDISGQFISGTSEDTVDYRNFLKDEMLKFYEIENAEKRIMFGSDFPIQSYADTIQLVEALGLRTEQKSRLYNLNAIELFNLWEDL
jgi:uncharacterized protein